MKNLLFVDDEPDVLQALQGQLHSMRGEWNMHFVGGGQQALEFLAANPVDVIITDMVMPRMDSTQLLAEVIKRYPSVVRIVLSGRANRETVLNLIGPAHQYLPKPCSADDLRATITRAFSLREFLGNEKLKRLTAQIKALPTSSSLRSEITQELRGDCPSLDRLGGIIARDIGMTAKILQLVNSAFFGLPRQITNPADAVAYLGLATVRALAFSAEIFSRFDPDQCRLFRLETLERHSWNTGLLARRIAHLEKQNNLVLDSCFLAGLMHDIGQLVFATSLGDQYNLVIARAGEKSQPLCIIEQEVFGASHAEVGAYLLGLWGLPNPILEAVAWHHAPEKNPSPQFSAVLAVHVADVLIHEKQVAYTEVPPPNLALDCLDRAGLSHRLPEWRAASLDHDNQ